MFRFCLIIIQLVNLSWMNANWCLSETDFLKVVPFAKYYENILINTEDGYIL